MSQYSESHIGGSKRQNNPTAKQVYNAECERLILEQLPELRGKFTTLGIWDSLNYCYLWNKTIPEAVYLIVSTHKDK
jgi:isoleucyl-tRNA synthetase